MQPQLEKIRKPHNASFRAFVRQERQFPFAWHYHPEFELTLITSGRGRRFVGDHIADFREGDLVLLGPLLPHTWRSGPSSPGSKQRRAIVIQFLDTFLGTVLVWQTVPTKFYAPGEDEQGEVQLAQLVSFLLILYSWLQGHILRILLHL